MTPQAAAAANAARALKEAAKNHKRSQAFHRRAGQQCMKALAELEEQCKAFGIKLVIEGAGPEEGPWPK